MTSRDFCYWLQGFFELSGDYDDGLGSARVDTIKRHLDLVFFHEIDPSFGDAQKQAALNAIHSQSAGKQPWELPPIQTPSGEVKMRC